MLSWSCVSLARQCVWNTEFPAFAIYTHTQAYVHAHRATELGMQ